MQTPTTAATAPTQRPTTSSPSTASDDLLRQKVSQAYFRKNQNIEPRTLELVIADLRQIIAANFRSLTPQDIAKAIDNGILGKYGEVYSVSVCAIVNWLNEYTIDPDRLAAMHNTAQAAKYALPQKATTTDAELNAMYREAVYRKYADFCEHGTFLDIHSISYDYLNRIGVLNPTDKDKVEIYAKFVKAENGRAEMQRRKGINPIGVTLSEIAQSNAVAKSKYYFLRKFFEDIKESGGDIRDYV